MSIDYDGVRMYMPSRRVVEQVAWGHAEESQRNWHLFKAIPLLCSKLPRVHIQQTIYRKADVFHSTRASFFSFRKAQKQKFNPWTTEHTHHVHFSNRFCFFQPKFLLTTEYFETLADNRIFWKFGWKKQICI